MISMVLNSVDSQYHTLRVPVSRVYICRITCNLRELVKDSKLELILDAQPERLIYFSSRKPMGYLDLLLKELKSFKRCLIDMPLKLIKSFKLDFVWEKMEDIWALEEPRTVSIGNQQSKPLLLKERICTAWETLGMLSWGKNCSTRLGRKPERLEFS